jgi:hypothetical protein
MVYLTNAFSLGMLAESDMVAHIQEISTEQFKQELASGTFISAVGHESTADILSKLLGIRILVNRQAIRLKENDIIYVYQLLQRLPEGIILNKEEIMQINFKIYKVRILKNSL